ncbi:MAG: phage holin family protein [Actinomycetota bacterium]|nr:phage holin family protein [Actinomycetota bacterium]
MATRQGHSQPAADERSLSELLSEMTTELSALFSKEVELIKTETKDSVSQAAKAGALLGAVAVGGLFALLLLAMAAAFGLAEVMATGLAFLVVGVVFLLVAGVAFAMARKKLAEVRPPEQAIATIKQDVEVAKSSIQRGASGPPGGAASSTGSGSYWGSTQSGEDA